MARIAEPSLGVDLVEIERAREFVREHRGRLARYFHPSEMRILRAHRDPARGAAVLLAAKECAFKAQPGAVWMGVDGFRRIRIARKDGRLHARTAGRPTLRLRTRLTRRYALAYCVASSGGNA